MSNNERCIYCEDAITWLKNFQALPSYSLVTSIPDISEFPGYTLEMWQEWFTNVATLTLSSTPNLGATIFYQSDIKLDGAWIDKSYLVQKAAYTIGHKLLWHKILCRVPPGTPTFGRPGYTHILAFSKDLKIKTEGSTCDVIPEIGEKVWARGMGVNGCLMIAKFLLQQTTTDTIVNPFCGKGSMIAVANSLGLKAIGIERSQKRVQYARSLNFDLENLKWSLLSK